MKKSWQRIKDNPVVVLRILMGLVFLSAGVYRIFFPVQAAQEMIDLHLPVILTWLIVILEILGGLFLLSGKFQRTVNMVMIIFLCLAIINVMVLKGREIIASVGRLFVFTPEPVSIFLHLVFIIILFVLFLSGRKR
jgi:uncharacterized membrane protein YphA (DoxX/SURF4 family)